MCDRGLTLGDLIGTLHLFFTRLGLPKLRFKPAYNPYTEPSMEIFRSASPLIACQRRLRVCGLPVLSQRDVLPSSELSCLRGPRHYCNGAHETRLMCSYSEELEKWIEVGNSGMFRPEMLRPMGLPEDVSVIAWGLSLER